MPMLNKTEMGTCRSAAALKRRLRMAICPIRRAAFQPSMNAPYDTFGNDRLST